MNELINDVQTSEAHLTQCSQFYVHYNDVKEH